MPYVAPKRLYLNADRSRLVEEGDPEASFLLAAAGATVPDADVRRYGLDTPDTPDTPDTEPAPTKETAAAEETEAAGSAPAKAPRSKG